MVSEGDAEAQKRVGELIANKYRLERLLGAGGMGAVYAAEHSFTGRKVAVKLMHEMFAKSKVLAERFIREARAPSAIGHRGIVEVLDGGHDEAGGLYLVLEMLEGQELADAYGGLSLHEIIGICAELLDALGAAHAAGFVHRDIKPDNVFLSQEGTSQRVKLLDFGVAGLLETEESTNLTKTGTILGTPMFMSPEQAKGEKVDHRADLWAVGAILYDALAGHPPYQGESYNALIVSIVTREHIPLSHVRPDLPRGLLDVIDRTLRKDPDERYQSAEEMAGALRAIPRDEAESKVVVRRKPEEQSTHMQRPLQPATTPSGRAGARLPADQSLIGVAATRLSEPMAQPGLRATGPDASAVSVGISAARPRPPRPATSAVQEPAGAGMGIWLAAGGAMFAIAIGVMLWATQRAPDAGVAQMAGATAPVAEQPSPATAPPPPTEPTEQQGAPSEPAEPPTEQPPAPEAADPEPQGGDSPEPPVADAPKPLGSDDLAAVMASRQHAIQRCYDTTVSAALLAGAQPQAVTMNVSLTVAPSGSVSSASVDGAMPTGLAGCVETQVRSWRFRATQDTATLHFPVVFQPTVIGR